MTIFECQSKQRAKELVAFYHQNCKCVGKKQQSPHVFKHVNLRVDYPLIPLLLGLSRTSLLLPLPLLPSLVRRGSILRQ